MKALAGTLAVILFFGSIPSPAHAATRLAGAAAIDGALREAALARSRDRARVDALLVGEGASRAAARLGIEIDSVRAAAARLSDAERRDLLQRAEALAVDPAAGHLDPDIKQLLVILLIVVIVLTVLQAVD